jgi:hypothetical protein
LIYSGDHRLIEGRTVLPARKYYMTPPFLWSTRQASVTS